MDDRLKEERSFHPDAAERNAAELRAGIARIKESVRDYRIRRRREADGEGREGRDSRQQ